MDTPDHKLNFFQDAAGQREFLHEVLDRNLTFKMRQSVGSPQRVSDDVLKRRFLIDLPEQGCPDADLLSLVDEVLSHSLNFASPNFLGFPDSGNSVAALAGSLVEATAQQNLLNASFCARAATFVEVATVRWLRHLVGWTMPADLEGVQQLGGVATYGGTLSNAYGLLMARHRAFPDSFAKGMQVCHVPPRVFVPSDLAHYSIRGAVGMAGLGTDCVVQVPTRGFRYDQSRLRSALFRCLNEGAAPVCVIVNAGDSRTLTVDDINGVCDCVRDVAPACWVHLDACHGHQLLFSDLLRDRLSGIERVDSVSMDPHKVLNIPYNLSYFLFKNVEDSSRFWISSQLIMSESWSLGQITPLIGSKTWASLKLYLHVLSLGRQKIANLIEERCRLAAVFRDLLQNEPTLLSITEHSDINSVPFVYVGDPPRTADLDWLNRTNEAIYQEILRQGVFYLHGFSVRDDANRLGGGTDARIFVLRYMAGNPLTSRENLVDAVRGVVAIGARLSR